MVRKGAFAAVCVSVQNPNVRKDVLDALVGEGVPACLLPSAPPAGTSDVRCRAIVYDLSPGGERGMATLRAMRAKRPFAKVLVYLPPEPDIEQIIQACD